MFVVNLTAGAL